MRVELRVKFHDLKDWLARRYTEHPRLSLFLVATLAFGLFTAYSVLRHLAFWTTYFDMGLYSSSMWRTTHGYDSWQDLIFPAGVGHISHLSPILGLLAGAYYLIADPIILLVIQSAAIAASAIPLYFISLRQSRNERFSLIIAGLFLTSPALQGIVRYDFHVESFIPLFVFLAYYAYYSGRLLTYYVSLALLLSTIEFSAVIGLGMMLSLWLEKRRLDRHLLVGIVCSSALLALVVISTTGTPAPIFGWPTNWLTRQFQGTGSAQSNGYLQQFPALLTNPAFFAGSLLHDINLKLVYLVVVFAPSGLGALKFPARILPAIPWTVIVLTSSRVTFYSLGYQYSAFLLPFVLLSAIPFLQRVYKTPAFVYLVRACIVLTLVFTPAILLASGPAQGWPLPSPLHGSLDMAISIMPSNATVLTQNDLFPQISNMPFATINYSSTKAPQFILIDKATFWYNWADPRLGIPLSAHEQMDRLFRTCSYELVLSNDDLQLYHGSSQCTTSIANTSDIQP